MQICMQLCTCLLWYIPCLKVLIKFSYLLMSSFSSTFHWGSTSSSSSLSSLNLGSEFIQVGQPRAALPPWTKLFSSHLPSSLLLINLPMSPDPSWETTQAACQGMIHSVRRISILSENTVVGKDVARTNIISNVKLYTMLKVGPSVAHPLRELPGSSCIWHLTCWLQFSAILTSLL